jgi:hypothetical protein
LFFYIPTLSIMFLSKLCAVVTSLLTTYACIGCCDWLAITPASWLESEAPTTLKEGGALGAVIAGAGAEPPPPELGIDEDVVGVGLSDFNAEIALAAPATLPAILAPAERLLIVTQGIPNVTGDSSTALAFAIAVLDIILEIDATWSTIILAIANALFSLPNALNTFCSPFNPFAIVATFASLADCSA